MIETAEQIILRPIQVKTFDACREAYTRTKRFILKATCGFGKTVIGAYMIQRASDRNFRSLFVADQINLIEQASETFDRYGIAHGIYQADNPRYNPSYPVQIGSIQTLNYRDIGLFDFIIIDEVHAFRKAHMKLMENNPHAYYLGLSATPYTRGLGKYFDFFIEPFTIDQMVAAGACVPYTMYSPSIADLSKLKIGNKGDWSDASHDEVFNKKDVIGDAISHWREYCDGKKTIAFGKNIEHLKNMTSVFVDAGIDAVQINANQQKEERDFLMNRFKNGPAKILCSVNIAVKGFDYPPVESILWILSTRSKIKWEQGCGRAFRISPETGKEEGTICDFGGNFAMHQWPDGNGFTRLNCGERSKKIEPVEPRRCIRCQVVVKRNARECPECGWDLRPEGLGLPTCDDSVELVEYLKPDPDSLEYKKVFLGGLNSYAMSKGYKEKNGIFPWSIHTYQNKFKEKPAGFSWKTMANIQPEVMSYIKYTMIRYAKRRRVRR